MKIGAVLSYATVAFNAIAGLLYTPWMILCIGSDDYALYTLAISIVNFFLMDFGLGTATSRFLSSYYADGKEEEARNFLGIVYKLYFLISLVILIVLTFVYVNIGDLYSSLGAEQLEKFRALFVIVAGYSVVSFPCLVFNGVLTSNEEFVGPNLCNLLQKVSCILIVIASLLFGLGVFALVFANAATSVFFSLAKYAIIRRRTGAHANLRYSDKVVLRETVGFSAWVVVTSIAGRLVFSIAPSILAVFSTSWEIAVFGLASSLEGYVYAVANALGSMFMPSITKVLHSQGKSEPLQALLVRYGRVQLYIVGLVIFGFFVLGGRFVDCWMGPEYISVYWSACLLTLPSLFELPQMAAYVALTAAGEVKARALAYSLMAVVSVVLMAPLSSLWGSVGASAAIMTAYLVRTLLLNVMYKRYLDIAPLSFYRQVFSGWILPTLAASLIVLGASAFLGAGGWLPLCCLALALLAIYVVLIWRFSLNEYEKNLFSSFPGKLARRSK